MLQNPCKTLGFKKNMVYEIPLGGEVNHIQPVAYTNNIGFIALFGLIEFTYTFNKTIKQQHIKCPQA